MKSSNANTNEAIFAAGGILLGSSARSGYIAIVRRNRYGGDVGLPKGKVQKPESIPTAALREVREETGLAAEIVGFAGTTRYSASGIPKVVVYFLMRASESSPDSDIDKSEISSVDWMTPRDAHDALTFAEDRDLVSAVFGLSRGTPVSPTSLLRKITASGSRSLQDERLVSHIAETWTDFDKEIHSSGPTTVTEPWAHSALTFLMRAESHFDRREIECSWRATNSAQRAILANPHNPTRIVRAAISLLREANKIEGWRAKAVQDLLCDSKGNLLPIDSDRYMHVIDAVALRDDYMQNTWYKIQLRRRTLLSLFALLWTAIATCLALSWSHVFGGFLANSSNVTAVVLMGILGASVSVAQSLVSSGVTERIPNQEIGSFLVWMRPGIGAVAALFTFALVEANATFHVLGDFTRDYAVLLSLSFVAGYSERFIVGAVEKLSQSVVKSKSG